jgi:polysaccharide biosynthesis/export protein
MRAKPLLFVLILNWVLAVSPNWIDAQTVRTGIDDEAAAATTTTKLHPATQDYVIGPDDILNINVWKEPEISRTLPVSPDGNISLPLVGDLTASGRTPVQLQSEIKQRLLVYFSDPEVNVSLQQAKSHKFNIVGEVEKPGSYVMTTPLSVLDGIAVAGGLRDFAKETKIYVLRENADGSHTRLPFNYKKVIRGNDLRQNVQLQPRDTIVVP